MYSTEENYFHNVGKMRSSAIYMNAEVLLEATIMQLWLLNYIAPKLNSAVMFTVCFNKVTQLLALG